MKPTVLAALPPPVRRGFLLLLGLCLMLGVGGCAKKASQVTHGDKLIAGMELSYPPFEMKDQNDKPSGIGVELAQALAAYLHKELVIENTSFDGLIPALKTGKIDICISSMTVNEERKQSIDFSDPYIHTGICMLVAAKSDIKGIADVDKPGRKVVVRAGTTGFQYVHDHFKQAEILQVREETACVLEVVQGKADCFIYDQMSIYQFAKQYPQATRAILEPFQHESWAIGIRKGNEELRTQVNAFLADFKTKKGMEALGEKYIKDKEAFRDMGFPFSL